MRTELLFNLPKFMFPPVQNVRQPNSLSKGYKNHHVTLFSTKKLNDVFTSIAQRKPNEINYKTIPPWSLNSDVPKNKNHNRPDVIFSRGKMPQAIYVSNKNFKSFFVSEKKHIQT